MRVGIVFAGSRWLAILLLGALLLVGLPEAVAGASTAVGVSAPTEPVAPGDEFTVSIAVVPGEGVAGMQFDLSFDPSLAAAGSVQEGDFLKQEGSSTFFNAGNIDNLTGKITGVFGAIITPGETASESGTFAVVSFIAREQSGTCPLGLSNVVVGDASGSAVTISVADSTVSIDQAPVLSGIGDKSVNENDTLSLTISGSDADGDPLTYSASNLPAGAAFDSAVHSFSWTPSLDQAGVYTGVRFEVSDGLMTDCEEITITVVDQVPPVLADIGGKSTAEGTTLSFTVLASDSNGDGLTYSALNLPVGAAFDPVSRVFSWTPGFDQAGVYPGIHFEVSDRWATDSEDVTITVDNVLRPDVNDDGLVNVLDVITIGQHWSQNGAPGWIRQDINEDGTVNVLDATLIGQNWTG